MLTVKSIKMFLSNVKHILHSVNMIVCLGPVGSGKTLLLKRLHNSETIDDTTTAVPTVGTNIFNIAVDNKNYMVRELGGSMAPLWSMYFADVEKVIYVVDASNLCQISAAGVLLYTVLVNPLLQKTKVSNLIITRLLFYGVFIILRFLFSYIYTFIVTE